MTRSRTTRGDDEVVLSELLVRLKYGKEANFKGLNVLVVGKKIYFYFYSPDASDIPFRLAVSDDGFNFKKASLNPTIFDQSNKPLAAETLKSLYFFTDAKTHYLLFSQESMLKKKWYLASSNHLIQWKTKKPVSGIVNKPAFIANFKYKKRFSMLVEDKSLRFAFSSDLADWKLGRKIIDLPSVQPEVAVKTKRGILVLYHSNQLSVRAIWLDDKNPEKVLQRPEKPLWTPPESWSGKKVYFIGAVSFDDKIIAYWGVEGEAIYAIVYLLIDSKFESSKSKQPINLKKAKQNPIIVPRREYGWESVATFNPGALYEQGKVHLVYRAIGDSYTSVLGYATSSDGIDFNYRSKIPIYTHIDQTPQSSKTSFSLYWSGGGFGGCEDPRLTKIGDRIYMTYVAIDGGQAPRVALTSISAADFLNQRWLWEKPVIITPPDVVDKNAVIFPEKIKEKYVIMHRVFPNILIDFVDNLEFDGTRWLKGTHKIRPRNDRWDSRKIGAGAPPIKTPRGWLLIYHGVDEEDSSRYKIGAMLLDLDDPSKVLHRTNQPILEPSEKYENEGFKFGIAYPCGAVVIKNQLFVYYGGADMVVCVATANLADFLAEIISHESASLTPITIAKISHV